MRHVVDYLYMVCGEGLSTALLNALCVSAGHRDVVNIAPNVQRLGIAVSDTGSHRGKIQPSTPTSRTDYAECTGSYHYAQQYVTNK